MMSIRNVEFRLFIGLTYIFRAKSLNSDKVYNLFLVQTN